MIFPLLILGGGGHAKVLIDSLRMNSGRIVGILDIDPAKKGEKILGVSVIGNEEVISRYQEKEIQLVNGLGSIGVTLARKELYEKFKKKGFAFANVIHPSSIICDDVELFEGAQIMAGAILQPGSQIGRNSIVNTGASVDHDCRIGDHVHIAPGALLSGRVQVDEGVHIGPGAIVLQGIRIGKYSVIGAGSVILKDVPAGVTVLGLPGKVRQ